MLPSDAADWLQAHKNGDIDVVSPPSSSGPRVSRDCKNEKPTTVTNEKGVGRETGDSESLVSTDRLRLLPYETVATVTYHPYLWCQPRAMVNSRPPKRYSPSTIPVTVDGCTSTAHNSARRVPYLAIRSSSKTTHCHVKGRFGNLVEIFLHHISIVSR